MLEMKPKCETCETFLEEESEAYICSYECTFCKTCTEGAHAFTCPNCGGELVRRPRRTKE